MKIIIALALTSSFALTACATPYDYSNRDSAQGGYDREYSSNYRNYDHDRYEAGQNGYYPERYYRADNSRDERRLSRNDRVYRGNDGRYYCRQEDGTTGLIIGAVAGGILGNQIDSGRSSLLGTLLGAGAGALLGREIDKGEVRCK